MKIKFNQKNIFKYLYLLVAIVSLFALYQVYAFGMNQVYSTIYTSDYVSLLQNKKYITDLNVSSFNVILDNLKKKSNGTGSISLSPSDNRTTGTTSLDIPK